MLDTIEQKDLWTVSEQYMLSEFRLKLGRCQETVKKGMQGATAVPKETLRHHFFAYASEQVGFQHLTKWISSPFMKLHGKNDELFCNLGKTLSR